MAPSLLFKSSVLAGAALVALVSPVSANVSQSLCSNMNTGSGDLVLHDDYLSASKCQEQCGGYAFAIVQYKDCYCSNFAPGDTTSTGDCNQECPGWPYEQCGSQGGSFGYIALDKQPEGTQGGSSSQAAAATSSTEAPEPATSAETVTIMETATPTPIVSISVISLQPSSETTSTTSSTPTSTSTSSTSRTPPPPTTATAKTSSSSSSSSSSSWSATPYMSVKTIQGGVQTVTITPTAPPAAAQTTDGSNEIHPTNKGGFWSDTGKVAGVFVVVGLLIAAMIGAIIFFLLRRRNSQNKATTITSVDDDPPNSGSGAPYMVDRRRSNLTLATTGLAGLTRGSSHDKSPNEKTPGSLSRRGSIPMGPHDQRLNPAALYNAHPNGSHASIASFRDDQDYSRPVLHVRNPDSE